MKERIVPPSSNEVKKVQDRVDQLMELPGEGRTAEAESILDALAAEARGKGQDEVLAETYFGLGRVLFRAARYREAAESFASSEAAADEAPASRSLPAKKKKSFCLSCEANRALSLSNAGFKSETISDIFHNTLRQYRQVSAASVTDLLSWGLLNYAAGRPSQARDCWKKVEQQAQEKSEMMAKIKINLATIDIDQRKFDDAQKKLDEAERMIVDAEEKIEDARTRADEGKKKSEKAGGPSDDAERKPEGADKEFEKAKRLASSRRTLLVTQADLAIAREDWGSARGLLDEAAGLRPFDAEIYYRLGTVQAKMEQRDDAEISLWAAVSIAPWHAEAQKALSRIQATAGGIAQRLAGFAALPLWKRGIATAAAGLLALGFIIYPIFYGPAQTTTTQTADTCAVQLEEGETCPPDQLTTTVTTTQSDNPRPHSIPTNNMIIAGALAVVALVFLVTPDFIKLKLGPLELERPGTVAPSTVPARE